MAPRPVHGLALCAGAAGLELGVRLALGPRYRAVAHVERDPYAAACLVARMADAALDQAPVWDDVATFDGRPWRGRVDIVTAGFPCQPWSAAGRRQGVDDDRWLWPHIARIVAEVGPGLVLLENVPGLLAGGLGPVLGSLADLGFDAEWDMFAAGDVGAPHLRRRLFVLAWMADRHDVDRGLDTGPGRAGPRTPVAARAGLDVAHPGTQRLDGGPGQLRSRRDPGVGGEAGQASGDGRRAGLADPDSRGGGPGLGHPGPGPAQRDEPRRPVDDMGDPRGPGPQRPGDPAPGRGMESPRSGAHAWPPGPGDGAAWVAAQRAGLPEPAVRRVADGLAHRLDRLHVIGNGVVPVVAGYALRCLARRAGLDLGDDGDEPMTAHPWPRRRLPVPAQMPGQQTIYDVLGDPA